MKLRHRQTSNHKRTAKVPYEHERINEPALHLKLNDSVHRNIRTGSKRQHAPSENTWLDRSSLNITVYRATEDLHRFINSYVSAMSL